MNFISLAQAKRDTNLSYLGSINSSAKIVKNNKIGVNTYILYLAPETLSGYNTCPFATTECKTGCLNTSGRTKMDNKNIIQNSRIKKTKLFYEQNEFFMDWLYAEIKIAKAKSERDNMFFSVRLNGTSDIDWVKYPVNGFDNIFAAFPDVQFYDYTKNPDKFKTAPNNYHLTFSYTGLNTHTSKEVLSNGGNVAVVFNVKDVNEFPLTFMGYEVLNGDETDYRPNDKKGCVVGLKWKHIKDKEKDYEISHNSRFVVQPDNKLCSYSKPLECECTL